MTEPPLKIGDRVKAPGRYYGRILEIVDFIAYVAFEDDGYGWYAIRHLSRPRIGTPDAAEEATDARDSR